MKPQLIFISLATLSIFLSTEGHVYAHMRDYLVNQPYYTTRKGEFEVELYNDLNLTDVRNDETYNSGHQVELEYGITDHLQLAYYELFKWGRLKDWQQDAFKIEGKYRFFESGELPVDIALYTEYKNPNGHQNIASDEIETKLILSRDLGPWNITANFTAERQINRQENWQLEYTAGVSYPIDPRIRLGLELRETLGDSSKFGFGGKNRELQLVPGVYANITPHMRVLFGPAIGLTRGTDDLQLKSIVEIEF